MSDVPDYNIFNSPLIKFSILWFGSVLLILSITFLTALIKPLLHCDFLMKSVSLFLHDLNNNVSLFRLSLCFQYWKSKQWLNFSYNQTAAFLDHQYFWKQSIGTLGFLHGNSHQDKVGLETTSFGWVWPVVLSSQIPRFFDHQYFREESIDILVFILWR